MIKYYVSEINRCVAKFIKKLYSFGDDIIMENDSFIKHLDYIYGLVEDEHQKCRAGNGKYSEKHLECILKELRIMRSINDGQFSPYYPRGITDTWDHDDELGNGLLKLAREYLRLKRTGQ